MTKDEAQAQVWTAIETIDPREVQKRTVGVRIEQRGEKFDVLIRRASYLFDDFAEEIRNVLGPDLGKIVDLGG